MSTLARVSCDQRAFHPSMPVVQPPGRETQSRRSALRTEFASDEFVAPAKAQPATATTATSGSPLKKLTEEVGSRMRRLDGGRGSFERAGRQAALLGSMVKDYVKGEYREIPWRSALVASLAVAYAATPVDLIPSWVPLLGQVDDALVIALAIKALKGDLKSYCEFKGYDPTEYFG